MYFQITIDYQYSKMKLLNSVFVHEFRIFLLLTQLIPKIKIHLCCKTFFRVRTRKRKIFFNFVPKS